MHIINGVEHARIASGGDGPIDVIRAGDHVDFEAGEDHWHGGAPSCFMTHIPMQEATTPAVPSMADHVTEDEYNAAPAIHPLASPPHELRPMRATARGPARTRAPDGFALETPEFALAEVAGALESLHAPRPHAQRTLLQLAERAPGRDAARAARPPRRQTEPTVADGS